MKTGSAWISFSIQRVALSLFGIAVFALKISAVETLVSGPAVELPALVVTEKQGPIPWRYGQISGLQILSACSDYKTSLFIDRVYRQQQLLDLLLPTTLQLRTAAPTTIIVITEEMQRAISAEVAEAMVGANMSGADKNSRTARLLPSLMLWADDSPVVFVALPEDDLASHEVEFNEHAIRSLLLRRTPALPAWFIEGFARFHGTAHPKSANNRMNADDWAEPNIDQLVIDRGAWLSDGETEAVRNDAEFPRALLPLRELFQPTLTRSDPAETQAYFERWASQAALFLRWGLDPAGGRRDAFLRFVEQASARAEPIDDAWTLQCFGQDLTDLRDTLSDFLHEAVNEPRTMPAKITGSANLKLHAATRSEIALTKGDWERCEIAYVKSKYPTLADKYIAQAGRTLRRAYEQDARDPRFLGVYGLFEAQYGDAAKAREVLTAAVDAQIVRPDVYYTLARLRYDEAKAHPAALGGKFSPRQVAGVVAPLLTASKQAPALAPVFDLLTEAWLRAAERPSQTDLAVLEEGLRAFPRSKRLLFGAALLNGISGDRARALLFIERALRESPTPEERNRLEKLRAVLAPSAAAARTN